MAILIQFAQHQATIMSAAKTNQKQESKHEQIINAKEFMFVVCTSHTNIIFR
jgi:hypothetical protein